MDNIEAVCVKSEPETEVFDSEKIKQEEPDHESLEQAYADDLQIATYPIKEEIQDEPDILDPKLFAAPKTDVACPKCFQHFSSSSDLEIHDIIHTNKKYCPLCKKVYSERKDLLFHVKTHMLVKSFSCKSCAKTFVSRKELTIHTRVHTNERPYVCDVCNKGFKQLGSLKDHKITHTKEKINCLVESCPLTFTTKSSLKRHLRRIHKLKDITDKNITCEVCDISFSRRFELLHHLKDHHAEGTEEEEHTCEECFKSFNSYFSLVVHTEDKHKMRCCNECNIKFGTSEEYTEHLSTHNTCKHCKKEFLTETKLKKHIRLVHSEPVSCDVCFKQFCNPQYLKSHKFLHKKSFDFTCNICSKLFKRHDYLRKHNRMFHKTGILCVYCSKSFQGPDDLEVHLKSHNFDEFEFECNHCDFRCMNKFSIQKHMKTIHPQLKFGCICCGKKFYCEKDRKEHRPMCEIKIKGTDMVICEICNRGYGTKQGLKKHINEKHSSFLVKEEIIESEDIEFKIEPE